MKEYAKAINLKNDPAVWVQYDRHHANCWIHVAQSFKQIGVLEMKIWRIDQHLFMVMQTNDDFDASHDFERYLSLDPRNQEWENLMTTFQEPLPQAAPGQLWADLKLVFQISDFY